jgi:hypothetical protein
MFVGGPIKPSNPEITDKGFYPNAIEFYDELIEVLRTANSIAIGASKPNTK